MYLRKGSQSVDWRKGEVTVRNIASWVKAEASLRIHGPVTAEVFEARKAACMGCEHRATNTEPPDEIGFCRRCGCGTSARARLSVKLTMPAATCPLDKWKQVAMGDGETNATSDHEAQVGEAHGAEPQANEGGVGSVPS